MLTAHLPNLPEPIFAHQTSPVDLSSPVKALGSFLAALERGDAATMRRCLTINIPSAETDRFIGSRGFVIVFSDLNVKVKTRAGSAVVLEATYRWTSRAAPTTATEQVICNLRDGEWRIVGGNHMIGMLAQAAGGNKAALAAFEASRSRARAVSCQLNGKQLILSTLMYCQDYDEVFPPRKWVEPLVPYFRNREVLTCPLDPPGTVGYSLNPAVAGQPLSKIALMADTVVIYEGRGGKLNFRHDGKATVGFADGHCVLVDARQAMELVWTLDGKPPKRPARRTKPVPKRP
ncbi:MAG: hypothetical protein ACKO5K_03100 [Armatimonadota bacterium]